MMCVLCGKNDGSWFMNTSPGWVYFKKQHQITECEGVWVWSPMIGTHYWFAGVCPNCVQNILPEYVNIHYSDDEGSFIYMDDVPITWFYDSRPNERIDYHPGMLCDYRISWLKHETWWDMFWRRSRGDNRLWP